MSEIINVLVGAALNTAKRNITPDIYSHIRQGVILTLLFIFLYFIPIESSIGFIIKAVVFFLMTVIVLYFF